MYNTILGRAKYKHKTNTYNIMNFLNKMNRSKTVLVLISVFLFSTGISAQLKLVDIKSADLATLSGVYGGDGTSKVEIVVSGNITFDATYYSPCFYGAQGALRFPGSSSYSYITIDNLGSDNITSVEIIGVCGSGGGQSNLFVAFSDKPSSATTDMEYSDNLDWMNATQNFEDAEHNCQTAIVSLPDPLETSSLLEIDHVKSVKIALTNTFGAENFTGTQSPFLLQGIAVNTDGNPTGLNNSMQEKVFTSYVSGNELKLTEPAQVSVYTISGTLVETVSNVDSILLNNLPSGMYVVKALSETGKTLVAKIVR